MQCPKCAHEQPDHHAICGRCGLVFEKYWKYHPRPGEAPPPPVPPPRSPSLARPNRRQPIGADDGGFAPLGLRLRALLLPPVTNVNPFALTARAGLWLLLVIWGLSMIGSPVSGDAGGGTLLHMANLVFHEAGHVIFMPFGAIMHSLGGTLGQLLMPLICMLVLLLQTRDPFGAAVALWWFGQNFLDIAPYINDARAGVLPLLGGNTGQTSPYGFHDWEFLLTESGLLHLDHALAQASHNLGSLIMLAALGWGLLLLWREFQRVRG